MQWWIDQLAKFFAPENMGLFWQSVGMTIFLTAFGFGVGFVLAFGVAAIRQSKSLVSLPFRLVVIAFVELFRRIPFLVIIYLVLFFSAAFIKGASLTFIGLTALCIYATVYLSEIVRGGFESVPRQQTEAAAAMNFSRWQTLRSVIIPQSMPVILPPAVAFAVAFVKDTSLVSQIGIFELAFRAKELVNQGHSAFFTYGLIALIYFALSYPLTRLGRWLETRLASPRGQRPARELRPA